MDVSDASAALTLLKTGFETFKSAIGLAKEAAGALPDEKKAIVDAALEKSERAAELAEAQIAKALGFRLCQCTFPPQIMLSIGYRQDDEGYSAEYFQCLNCRKEWPPPAPRASTYTDEDEIPQI